MMDIETPNCVGCPYIHPDNGNCTAVGGFCTAVPAAHCPLIPELRGKNERLRQELAAATTTLLQFRGVAPGEAPVTLFGLSLERVQELADADRAGLVHLRSAGAGHRCGECGHWRRIQDTRRGTCAVRRWERDRRGTTDPGNSFTPSQSHSACRDYIPREDD